MTTPVSIIIPAHNQLEYCRQCVESLRTNTDYPYKLILVDNGSTDGVSEYFDSIPGATVVHLAQNLGFPAGVNRGLEHADGHVLLLNSDTVLPAHWLTRLVSAMESAGRIGIVGPMSNCVSGPQLIDGLTLHSIDEINALSDQLSQLHGNTLLDVERAVGFCMLIRDAAFREVGILDEAFGIGNFEDDDYCLRVRKAGYRVCIAPGCFVFHFGSRTFQSLGFSDDSYRTLIADNQRTFESKWGVSDGGGRFNEIAAHKLSEARAHRAKRDLRSAMQCIAEALALNPQNADGYNDLGVLLVDMGDIPRAIQQFERALAISPAHELAATNLRDLSREDG